MATRIYLPASGTAPLGSLAVNAGWELSTSLVRLPCYTVKSNTALATTSLTWGAELTQQWCWKQYQSLPMVAAYDWTTSDTVSMVIGKCSQAANQTDTHLAYVVRVVSGDGATIRGVIGLFHAASTEFALVAAAATRIHSARTDGAANFSSLVGDRIIIEIGLHGITPSLTQVDMRFGDPTATADFALTEALTTDLVPWVELSRTVSFDPPIPVSDAITLGESKTVTVSEEPITDRLINVSDGLTIGETTSQVTSNLLMNVNDGLTIDDSTDIYPILLEISISDNVNVYDHVPYTQEHIVIGDSVVVSNPLPSDFNVASSDGLTIGEPSEIINANLIRWIIDEGVPIGENLIIQTSELLISSTDGLTIGESKTVSIESVEGDDNVDVSDGIALEDFPKYYSDEIIVRDFISIELISFGINAIATDNLAIDESKIITISDLNIIVNDDLVIGENTTQTTSDIIFVVTVGLTVGDNVVVVNPLQEIFIIY